MAESTKVELTSEIYDILDDCTSAELASLVDLLVKFQVSTLKITRAFERFYPDHASYTDQIGDEIYRLSVMALGRSDGRRPSYKEMVVGLCEKIGISMASNSVTAGEAALLNTFTKRHLSSLPVSERRPVVDQASIAASNAAKGILSSEAWPPFASALLQLAYLRRMLIESGRSSVKVEDAPQNGMSSASAPISDTSDGLVIQTEDGNQILSLAVIPENEGSGWRGEIDSRKAFNVLTPILKALQPFVSTEQMLKNGNYMRLTLPPGVNLDAIKDAPGSFYGSARDATGHFSKIKLDPVSLAGLASPAAILILASAIAEQKKFEHIEKSLDDIKASIGGVSKFQKDERRAVLTGSIRYFQQVAPSVFNGELANEVLHEIERHEVELGRVQEHYIADIQGQIAALRAIKNHSLISSKNYVNAIQEAWTVLNGMYGEVLLCIRTRACGYQLLCAYPGRESGKKARLDDINRALGIFSTTGEATIAIDQVLREKLEAISSYETKAIFLTKENTLFDHITKESLAIFEGLRTTVLDTSKRMEPISIDLKIEDGRVVALR